MSVRTCFRPIPLLSLTLFAFQLAAVTVNTAQLVTGPSNSNCAVPPVATSFLTTSTEIWAYLLVDQGATNDVLRVSVENSKVNYYKNGILLYISEFEEFKTAFKTRRTQLNS